MGFDIEFERAERRRIIKKVIGYILRWSAAIALAILAAWAVTRYCLEITNMLGDSMEVTLKNDDVIMINKLAYVKNDPERYDIIVFEKNGTEHSYYSIKRVIGLPGEHVQIINGEVYINDDKLDEPMNVETMNLSGLAGREITLDEDEFFVLGDNRNDSEDSRFTTVGNVVRNEIIGEAWIRTNNFSFISGINMSGKKDSEEADKK